MGSSHPAQKHTLSRFPAFGKPGKWLLVLSLILSSATALGQAGSSPPVIFYADGSGAGSSYSGASGAAGGNEPVLPAGVLKLAEQEQYLLWVELTEGRLKILERDGAGGMALKEIVPISIGRNGYGKQREGDGKTPVGVYRLTSFLKDDSLIDYYGIGAFPLNYPNVLDRRLHRTGSGIWLHGLPKDVSQRPLMDSDGCVVVDNDSLLAMNDFITTGITHVVLSDVPLRWVPKTSADKRSQGLQQEFEAWRRAWENRDNDAYLAFYSDDFNDFHRRKRQWAAYKTRVNNGKDWIRVSASEISFYAEPGRPDLVTVRYYQDYASNNFHWRGWKEQLWRETDDKWRIVYEGNG